MQNPFQPQPFQPKPGEFAEPPRPTITQAWRARFEANKANALAAAYPNPLDHDAQVAALIRKGYHIEIQTAEATQMVTGHRVNHILHLLLTVFTAGLWLPVWIVVAAVGGGRREIVARNPRA
jgi:hypothetical protein